MTSYYGTLLESWFCSAFRSYLRCSRGEISGIKILKYAQILLWASDHSCCKPSTTVVSPPVLSSVINWVRRSELVVYNRRPLCWRRQSRRRWANFFSQFAVRSYCLFISFFFTFKSSTSSLFVKTQNGSCKIILNEITESLAAGQFCLSVFNRTFNTYFAIDWDSQSISFAKYLTFDQK